MKDNLEKFVRDNRDAFDGQNPPNDLWPKIEGGLNAAGAGGGAGGGFLAKLGLGVKVGIGAGAVALVAAALVWVFSGKPESPAGGQAGGPGMEGPAVAEMPASPRNNPVAPPFRGVDIPFGMYKVSTSRASTLEIPGGTRLHFPEGAFVDEKGVPVNGKVEVRYREFHDAADAIVAGITMKYDHNGKSDFFQTAGMMEIRASQQGEPVFLADGKTIQVDLASRTDEPDHRLYFLNPETGRWEDIGQADMRPLDAPGKEEVVSEEPVKEPLVEGGGLPTTAPVKPIKASKKSFSFAVDYKDFPELEPIKNLKWDFVNKEDWAGKEWVFTQVWADVKLEEGTQAGQYKILLKDRKGKVEALAVSPALSGEEYEDAEKKYEEAMKGYSAGREIRKGRERREKTIAMVYRSFSISNLGIFNCDRVLNGYLTAQVEFDYNGLDLTPGAQVFQILQDQRGVIEMGMPKPNEQVYVKYTRQSDCAMLSILPDGKLAVIRPLDFDLMDREIREGKPGKLTFQALESPVTQPQTLRDLMVSPSALP